MKRDEAEKIWAECAGLAKTLAEACPYHVLPPGWGESGSGAKFCWGNARQRAKARRAERRAKTVKGKLARHFPPLGEDGCLPSDWSER